jgi:hypothetical protein
MDLIWSVLFMLFGIGSFAESSADGADGTDPFPPPSN